MSVNNCSARIADVIIIVPIFICLFYESANTWIQFTFFDVALMVNNTFAPRVQVTNVPSMLVPRPVLDGETQHAVCNIAEDPQTMAGNLRVAEVRSILKSKRRCELNFNSV